MKSSTATASERQSIAELPKTMRALVKEHQGPRMSLREIPVPSYGPTDVLIRVRKAGICGTDQHIWNWDPWAASRVHPPRVIGHEFMGVVAAVGELVKTVAVGDRVSGEGHIADGTCLLCRIGQPHICADVKVIGVDRDGCFADYIAMPESNVWKLDTAVPDTWAAIFDPFGNAVHTVSEAHVSLKSVLITGAGSIGLMSVAVAAAAGASRIIAIDPNPHKLALATQLGAHAVFDPADPDLRRGVRTLTGEAGPDVFLEMSGNAAALESGLALLRHGGRAAILGISAGKVTLDVSGLIVLKGITVLGIFGRKIWETWYQMEALVKDRRVDLAPVISHVVPFERFEECFTTLKQREAVKIVMDLEA